MAEWSIASVLKTEVFESLSFRLKSVGASFVGAPTNFIEKAGPSHAHGRKFLSRITYSNDYCSAIFESLSHFLSWKGKEPMRLPSQKKSME